LNIDINLTPKSPLQAERGLTPPENPFSNMEKGQGDEVQKYSIRIKRTKPT